MLSTHKTKTYAKLKSTTQSHKRAFLGFGRYQNLASGGSRHQELRNLPPGAVLVTKPVETCLCHPQSPKKIAFGVFCGISTTQFALVGFERGSDVANFLKLPTEAPLRVLCARTDFAVAYTANPIHLSVPCIRHNRRTRRCGRTSLFGVEIDVGTVWVKDPQVRVH